MSLKNDLQIAIEAARGAGAVALEHYGKVRRLTKTHKAAKDEAVTEADRAGQRFIVKHLKKHFPTDGFVGEESDSGESITFECPDPNGRVWVIDPIDGTNNFVGGFHQFAVCLGLMIKGQPALGVVYEPVLNSMYSGIVGEGAWLDGKRIHAASTGMADSSLLMLTASLLDKTGKMPPWVMRWMGQTTWKVRILGSAALEAVHVASGVAHAAVTINGKLWDAAAPAAIVLAAGGKFTDLAGKPVFPFDLAHYEGAKVPFLAAAPEAHAELVEELNRPG